MNVKLIIKRKNSFVMKKMLLHNYYMKKKIYIYISNIPTFLFSLNWKNVSSMNEWSTDDKDRCSLTSFHLTFRCSWPIANASSCIPMQSGRALFALQFAEHTSEVIFTAFRVRYVFPYRTRCSRLWRIRWFFRIYFHRWWLPLIFFFFSTIKYILKKTCKYYNITIINNAFIYGKLRL